MALLRDFFTGDDQKSIAAAIMEAESRTSGEIRVRVEAKTGEDPMQAARRAFEALGMRNTELHNGVLFFVAVEDRKFIVLGDDGINGKVPGDFWDSVRDVVIGHFRGGRFAQGLTEGIKIAGKQLASYFPYERGDVDELPNAISFADEEGA
jgi:uncharacterized membrane protein